MKLTLLIQKDGSAVMTVPHEESKTIVGTVTKIERIGRISEVAGLFNVTFIGERFSGYNKSGFTSYNEAVAYEQDILDAHLNKKFEV